MNVFTCFCATTGKLSYLAINVPLRITNRAPRNRQPSQSGISPSHPPFLLSAFPPSPAPPSLAGRQLPRATPAGIVGSHQTRRQCQHQALALKNGTTNPLCGRPAFGTDSLVAMKQYTHPAPRKPLFFQSPITDHCSLIQNRHDSTGELWHSFGYHCWKRCKNIDASITYPASFTNPNIMVVAASTPGDKLADFSSWGAVSVDFGLTVAGPLARSFPIPRPRSRRLHEPSDRRSDHTCPVTPQITGHEKRRGLDNPVDAVWNKPFASATGAPTF